MLQAAPNGPLSTDARVNWWYTASNPERSFVCRSWGLVPGTRTALLTATSKMPGPSWSLPAGRGPDRACPWANGTICHGEPGAKRAACYAQNGHYVRWSVLEAQRTRLRWTIASQKTLEGREAWVQTMVTALTLAGFSYFRWHDSGDLYAPVYARMVAEVIRRTPGIRHWIATRAYQAPWAAEVLPELAELPNCTIRPSALDFDAPPPEIDYLDAGLAASATAPSSCPAPSQGGHCGDCRQCWNDPTTPVTYRKH